jgi:YidC/Oxa1 family membrane protein insertase
VNQNIRLIAFVVVAFGILFMFNMWMGPKPSPVSSQAPVTTAAVPQASAPTAVPTAPPMTSIRKGGKVAPAPKEAALAEIVVDTPLYRAVLTNKGACVKGFELKGYKNRRTDKLLQLVSSDTASPKPLELSYDPAGDLTGKNWEIVGDVRTVTLDKGENTEVSFRTGTGLLTVVKTIVFDADKYVFDVNVEVKVAGRGSVPAASLVVEGPSDLGHEEFTGTQSRASGYRCSTYAGESMNTEKPKRSQEGKDIAAPVIWAALADQFYVAAILPDPATGAASARIVRDNHPQVVSADEKSISIDEKTYVARPRLLFPAPALSTGEGFRRHFTYFLGPQVMEHLQAVGSHLEKVLDYGMFEFISFYLLVLLKWFYSWCHNWGVAIILLSIMVKAVLWWPNHISFKHMSVNQKKMQALQPKLEAIKKKFANDKTKQNEETMKLYQEANINLTSGCLPMLLQIPIFIALYSALSKSIELRGAPFVLWIQDLSLKDPGYVLPLLMGASMFLQQKLSSQATSMGTSAGQQKFMLWMFPILLTFMSFQWPSGLLVYWVVTNLLSIWQQKMVNKAIQKAG